MNFLRICCLASLWLAPGLAHSQTIVLQAPGLNESSGIAQVGQQLWLHNDSGDSPRFFVFQKSGELLGKVEINGAKAFDWEDMCSFTRDGKQYVAVGDVGDNSSGRQDVQIYVIEIPTELAASTSRFEDNWKLPVAAEFRVTYPEGSVDCEAVAYDPLTESFLLATKELLRCRLHAVPATRLDGSQKVEARLIGTVYAPLVTGADISPDGRRLVLSTYGPGALISRNQTSDDQKQPAATWLTEGEGAVKMFALPARKQGESICFSNDGRKLWLTSEHVPTPLIEVSVP